MSALSYQEHALDEQGTAVLGFTVYDETGTPVPFAALTSATLTLYDKRSGAILNARDHVSILNANNVTYGATSGQVRWSVQPADSVIQNDQLSVEAHVALFEFFWLGGAFRHELRLNISNIANVT